VPEGARRAALRWFAALGAAAALSCPGVAASAPMPIFDAHIHYSHDAWDNLPPPAAIAILREAGVRRALVSSSGDEGTQRLSALAPELIVPSLRPYRSRSEVSTWVRDPTVVAFLEERLAKSRYAAIGEFHVYGADADLPVVRRLVALGKEHRLVLHAHSDADAIERLFRQDPDARILWAHSGFDRPDAVRELLRRHRNLWCDLAFRSEHGAAGKVPPEWRALFTEFPDRFMVGTDTFTPERWHYIVEHANWSRAWLAELPPALAERIAWRNAEALFGSWSGTTRK
jgi:predicted TIM-barrel fold metal-dependent hydrolase